MARHEWRDRVGTVGRTHCACRLRVSYRPCNLAVAACLAGRHARYRRPDNREEVRTAWIERHAKRPPPAGEVLAELIECLAQMLARRRVVATLDHTGHRSG